MWVLEGEKGARQVWLHFSGWLFSFSSMSWCYIDIQVTKGEDEKFGMVDQWSMLVRLLMYLKDLDKDII